MPRVQRQREEVRPLFLWLPSRMVRRIDALAQQEKVARVVVIRRLLRQAILDEIAAKGSPASREETPRTTPRTKGDKG